MSDETKKSHFSAEEMVRAAQSKSSSSSDKPSETKEVVVREDGTKVVRVRKRKRSSSSDVIVANERDNNVYLKVVLGVAALVVLLGLVSLGVFFFRMAYYNSPNHIVKVEKALSGTFGSDVELKGYRVGPTYSEVYSLKAQVMRENTPSVEIELRNMVIDHKVETLITGALNGSDASAKTGVITVQNSSVSKLKKSAKRDEVEPDFPYHHNSFAIDDLSLRLGAGSNAVSLVNTDASLQRRANGDSQLYFRGGQTKHFLGFPSEVESGLLVLSDGKLQLQSLKLNSNTTGQFNLSGSIAARRDAEMKLNCDIVDYRLEDLSSHLANVIEARVSSQGSSLSINPSSSEYLLSADLKISAGGLALKNLKFLEVLAEKMGYVSYVYVSFLSENSVELLIDRQGYQLANLDLENQGSLGVKGALQISHEGFLSGDLKVGIPLVKVYAMFPDLDRDSLSKSKGFAWFDIVLSGTANSPSDNFLEVFNATVDALR